MLFNGAFDFIFIAAELQILFLREAHFFFFFANAETAEH
jgi:hypothetical protein